MFSPEARSLIKRHLASSLANLGPLEIPARRALAAVSTSFPTFQHEQLAFAVIRQSLPRDAICVDVGCNAGLFLDYFQRCAPDGTVYAFEPVPHLYQSLVQRFGHNRSMIFSNVALGERAEECAFYAVPEFSGLSGFYSNNLDRARFGDYRVEELRVAKTTLDEALKDAKKIDLVKIDVEGAELAVFQGAGACLLRHRPIVLFEHQKCWTGAAGTSSEELYDLLTGPYSYTIIRLSAWFTGGSPLCRDEFCRLVAEDQDPDFIAIPKERSDTRNRERSPV